MSCSGRAKTSFGTTSDLVVHQVLNNYDAMCEIFLLLPPETIYQLIRVSKRWLQIISCPFFRQNYFAKWKPSSCLGFFITTTMYLGNRISRPISEPSLMFLSTSSLADEIESYAAQQKLGYYIDSSKGVLLCGRHPKTYYLWDPMIQKHSKIPCPRERFNSFCMSLMTEDCPDKGFTYKLVRAESVSYKFQSKKVRVETYSSKTTTWSYSELTCQDVISLCPWSQGRVIQGVFYWYATRGGTVGYVAIYDSNDEEKNITLMELPKTFDYDVRALGESSNGCLQYGCNNKSVMGIWKLEKVSGVLQWNPQYKLYFKEIWKANEDERRRFCTPTKETQLLAFLNQKSNSLYIKCASRIFVCDLSTLRIQEVQYKQRKSSVPWDFYTVLPFSKPLWPSPLLEKKRNNC